MSEPSQTLLLLTQGDDPGITTTHFLENQIRQNGGKLSFSFCGLPQNVRATRLEFRFLNGIPKDKIIMNFTQGCPDVVWGPVTEFITNQIEGNSGRFVMTFPKTSPPLNTAEFQFE